jgi:ceramide glucosyltransferase
VFGAIFPVVSTLALLLSLASLGYLALALVRVRAFARRRDRADDRRPPVTILKPLYGDEPGLYENLRSFCEQNYPVVQVVFGVRAATDPAVPVVERLRRDLPGRDLRLVVNDRVMGANLKASNLANMYEAATHDRLVIADSDIRVGPDYVGTVVGPLADPRVGVVTCLYAGRAVGGLWSALGAMFMHEWFLPSVLVAWALRPDRYCFGATMAVRRDALEAIGGFAALAPYLADDYVLGARMNERGLAVWLSSYVVESVVHEPTFRALFAHELRWARTMRTAQSGGYAMSFVTYSIVLSFLYLLLSSVSALGGAVFGGALALRIVVHYAVRAWLGVVEPPRPWLIPVRDALCFVEWAASFCGRTVEWGGRRFSVAADGRMWTNGGSISC